MCFKDKQLIDHSKLPDSEEEGTPEFRIWLVYMELYMLRKIFDVRVHEKIMSLLKSPSNSDKRFLRYFYNRVQVNQ